MKLWAFVFIALFAAVFFLGATSLVFCGTRRRAARRRRLKVLLCRVTAFSGAASQRAARLGWCRRSPAAFHRGKERALRLRGDGALQKRGLVQLCEFLRLQKSSKGRGQNRTLANPSSPRKRTGLFGRQRQLSTAVRRLRPHASSPARRTSFAGEQSKNYKIRRAARQPMHPIQQRSP